METPRKRRIYRFTVGTAKIRDGIQFAHETIGFSEVCRRYHKSPRQVTRDVANGVIHPLATKGRKSWVYSTYELDIQYGRRGRVALDRNPLGPDEYRDRLRGPYAWRRTVRGGRQLGLPDAAARAS